MNIFRLSFYALLQPRCKMGHSRVEPKYIMHYCYGPIHSKWAYYSSMFRNGLRPGQFFTRAQPSPIQRQNVLDGFLTNLHRLTKKKKKY